MREGKDSADLVRTVGIVADSHPAADELLALLACEGAGPSRTIAPAAGQRLGAPADLLAGLKTLQRHRATEVLILAVTREAPAAVPDLLAQVQASDKPAVVCVLGADPRLAWQAGAIPARRLDEAALRAAAWVRGWDQALVSSQLQEQDEELAVVARAHRPRLGRGRRRVAGLLSNPAFCHEARLMLAELAPAAGFECASPAADRLPLLPPALGTRDLAAILWDAAPGSVGPLAGALGARSGPAPLFIVHLCAAPSAARSQAEALLQEAGAIIAGSNAAAARLAALLLRA